MSMNKKERKEAYVSIINLMLQGDSKEAYEELTCMCGNDAGLFIMVNYEERMKILKSDKFEVQENNQ